jgi:hypothetical protein
LGDRRDGRHLVARHILATLDASLATSDRRTERENEQEEKARDDAMRKSHSPTRTAMKDLRLKKTE